ncbi:hypothetical protein SynBIOSE41_01190 [Synechococcus sp. BIOS-E4-1]|nr:hypothetical protein SynBIOSE41_01190 [Synechococcus sp. BIOS-E4-1]
MTESDQGFGLCLNHGNASKQPHEKLDRDRIPEDFRHHHKSLLRLLNNKISILNG